MKRIFAVTLALLLAFTIIPAAADCALLDVTSDLWCHEEIETLYSEGVINGYEDGCYHPERTVTYGAALKLVLRAGGTAEQAPTEERGAFGGYYNYALKKGYIEENEITALEDDAPRLFIARLTARALRIPKLSDPSPYKDVDDGYATALYYTGIMQGSDVGMRRVLKAKESINRGEMAAVVWRIGHTQWRRNFAENSGRILLSGSTYKVNPSLPESALDLEAFSYDENGLKTYPGARIGVDVSTHQGEIDWQKVAAAGVEFAIVRVGYRGTTEGILCEDDHYLANIIGAQEAGLTVGVYVFSQAVNEMEALEEASFVLERIEGLGIDGPVVFDWESYTASSNSRSKNVRSLPVTACAQVFCDLVRRAGYTPMVYFNQSLAYSGYDLAKLTGYDWWLAEYNANPNFYYAFQMWQYTDEGRVPGIKGYTDVDIWFAAEETPQ